VHYANATYFKLQLQGGELMVDFSQKRGTLVAASVVDEQDA
jgi:hypothetical protein